MHFVFLGAKGRNPASKVGAMAYGAVVGVLLLVFGAVAAQPGPSASGRLSPSLQNDARLEKAITLSRKQIYLGELLDEISEQTGARIEVAGRMEPASGFLLSINVRVRPAREVMEAVRRLYDLPPVRWSWEREQKAGKARHLLNCSHPLGVWGNLRRAFADQFMLDELRKKGHFLSLPPQRRAAAAEGDPFLQAVNRQFQRSAGFYSFVGGLSEDELLSIVRGKVVNIPLSQLSQFQRDFIRSEFALSKMSDKFDSLEKVRLVGSGEDRPGVFLDLGKPGAHGVMGSFALGQAMDRRDAQLEKNWIAKGEAGGPPARAAARRRSFSTAIRPPPSSPSCRGWRRRCEAPIGTSNASAGRPSL